MLPIGVRVRCGSESGKRGSKKKDQKLQPQNL